jgi:thiol-disulfide isomerase/thioredoxin
MSDDHGHDHDHKHDGADGEAEELLATQLTTDFAPGLVPTANYVVLEGEAVVLDEVSGATHLLNETGALVLQCFDGAATIDEIAVDVAEAFNADKAVVAEDILGLARELGQRGLLEGVTARQPMTQREPVPSIPVGTVLTGLDARIEDGPAVDDAWVASGPALLVSWSPRCGYCKRVIPDLAELEMPLAAAGVRLMLVTTGSPEDMATQFADGGGVLPTAYAEEIPDFFTGLGTPVAYAVGADGQVSEPLAVGALDVPQLARALAGVTEDSTAG